MQDLMLRAYKASHWMEPIALRDYYVKIITYQQEIWRKVSFYEVIPPFQAIDLGAISAGQQSSKTAITNLDLWDNEFGQWRWFPLDNAQIRLYLPSGVGKWQLKNLQVALDKSIINRDPSLVSTEICSWEDDRPAMEAVNFTDYNLSACRIVAMGYRFHTVTIDDATILSKLNAGTQTYTPIQCAGFTGGD